MDEREHGMSEGRLPIKGSRAVIGPFEVRRRGDGWIVSCSLCFVVSGGGGAIRHAKSPALHSLREVKPWMDDHEHTEIRTLEDAHAVAAKRARNARALREARRDATR
jgi:hypothetical protein